MNSVATGGHLHLIGLTDVDYRAFPQIRALVKRHGKKALDALYARMMECPETASLFASRDRMGRAQTAQTEHWAKLFSGPLDDDYLARAQRIGRVHAEQGIAPRWYVEGYALVLDLLIEDIMQGAWNMAGKRRVVRSLVKAALMDMSIALSTYSDVEAGRRTEVIERIGQVLGRLADGDYTQRLDGMPSSFARVSDDFDAMRERTSTTLAGVAKSAQNVKVGSAEISLAAGDLARRTEGQASQLETAASAIQQVVVELESATQAARNVSANVLETHRQAEAGGQIIGEVTAAMHSIAASSSQIEAIIGVIDDIAFQTNLLALNAGIEAARAGGAGKGFAVVASEVRALAQRATESAKHIRELIVDAAGQVDNGVQSVEQMDSAFAKISSSIDNIKHDAASIAETVANQASRITRVNSVIAQLDVSTQQNAAMVEESTAAAKSLALEAQQLAGAVAQFSLPDEHGPLDAAVSVRMRGSTAA